MFSKVYHIRKSPTTKIAAPIKAQLHIKHKIGTFESVQRLLDSWHCPSCETLKWMETQSASDKRRLSDLLRDTIAAVGNIVLFITIDKGRLKISQFLLIQHNV